jgi:hypothetical protein
VGGMRGEYQRKHGPKFGIIMQLAKCNIGFRILREVRCDEGNIVLNDFLRNLVLKYCGLYMVTPVGIRVNCDIYKSTHRWASLTQNLTS